jgi:hypothetical protein
MSCRLFLFALAAALSAARAEIPIDLPAETATNRSVPGITVPAPLGTDAATNAVAVPASSPRPRMREQFQRAETSVAGDD